MKFVEVFCRGRLEMKQLTAIAFVVVLLTVPAISQQATQQQSNSKCTAKFAQAFSIRGVHLGMSADELFTLFPDTANNESNRRTIEDAKIPPKFGQAYFHVKPGGNVTKEKLAGISSIFVELFDNRIVSYSVSYEGPPNGPKWDNVDDWIAKLSETLKLPDTSEWVPRDGAKVLNCEGIRIQATTNRNGSIWVIKDDWLPELRGREKAYEEQKRREFKP
jgi:hypothetical protein